MRCDRRYSGETLECRNKALTTFAGAVFSNTVCFRKSYSELVNVFKVSKGFGDPILDNLNIC